MWDWLLLLLTLLLTLYWYLTRQLGHWRALGVYTLPGAVPVLGHSWDVVTLRKGSGRQYCEIYE